MIDSKEIKKAINNTNAQNLLSFGNRIINLSHVIEFGADYAKGNYKIFFKYSDGSSYEQSYDKFSSVSNNWEMIEYCIFKGLLSIELTPAYHARWAKTTAEEI